MKRVKCTILFIIYITGSLFAQTQMIRWALPGNQLYFNPNPVVQSLPTSVNYYASNATTDNAGNLLFYIVDRKLYSASGVLCGTFNANAAASGSSIGIVPIPEQCKNYYIIMTSNNEGSLIQQQYLEYAKVDANGANPVISQQTTLLLNSISGSSTGSVGFAISKIVPNTAKRFLYFVGSDTYAGNPIVSRFDITSSGINNKVAIATTSTPGIVTTSPIMATEVDLSPNGAKLAWVSGNDGRVNVITLNPANGNLISAANANIAGGTCYGVEWNAASTMAYVSHYTGLKRVVATTMAVSSIASSSLYNNSQLEMGRDGYIYAVKNNGSGFGIINTTSHAVSPSPLVITLNGMDYSLAYYTLPNQVDGEDYSNFMKPIINIQNTPVCTASGTQITLNAIPNNYPNYSWYHSTDGYVSVISTSNNYTTPANSNTSINYKVCTTSSVCGTGCSPVGNVRWCAPGVMCCIPKRESYKSDEAVYVLDNITIQPNPSNGNFQINLYDNSSSITSVQIFDLRGKLVKSILSDNLQNIDASELISGIYFLEVNTDSEKLKTKISIQN